MYNYYFHDKCLLRLRILIVFTLVFQDMFEKVNKAYEFLCTKSARIVDGPDPENIILILKTQSILFNRHQKGFSMDLSISSTHVKAASADIFC